MIKLVRALWDADCSLVENMLSEDIVLKSAAALYSVIATSHGGNNHIIIL